MYMQHSSNMNHTLNDSKVVTHSALLRHRHVDVVATTIIRNSFLLQEPSRCVIQYSKSMLFSHNTTPIRGQ